MSAALLRQAAKTIRHNWPMGMHCPTDCNCDDALDYHPEADRWNAVADWLDHSARFAQFREDNGSPPNASADPRPLRLARLIVGEGA